MQEPTADIKSKVPEWAGIEPEVQEPTAGIEPEVQEPMAGIES